MASTLKSKIADSMHRKARRWTYRLQSVLCRQTMPAPAAEEIDVVIPVVEKDLDVLPLCVEGVRRQLTNPLGRIYLVGPPSERLSGAAATLGCEFVDETTVLGYGPRDIDGAVTPGGVDRRGWVFQQLLKLSGRVGRSRRFLVIDSDHVLVAPHTFVASDGRSVLYQSKEYHGAYFRSIARLMGARFAIAPLSFVAHKMVFDRQELARLRQCLEERNQALGPSWDRIVVASLDMTEGLSPFSEYELYGNFLPAAQKQCLLWRQRALAKPADGTLPGYDELVSGYGRKYLSVTFPDYKKK